MEFLEARRLPGPNLHFNVPAAVLDIACRPAEADLIVPLWHEEVGKLWAELGEPAPRFSRIDLEGGVSLAFTAPIDALYTASDVNERACARVAARLAGTTAVPAGDELVELLAARDEERNPALLALAAAAAQHDVTLLWDDDEVSLGMGRSVRTWPAGDLPAPETVDWASFHDIPVGLVTGTNGKTTTVRLAQHILRGMRRVTAVSSTDWIAVDDKIIDRGDWSGPGGARAVLRQAEVQTAILESARGGLLRRGLGIERADAALITNISADHLGDFGSRNLVELLQIKWIVSQAVVNGGKLILNADDEQLVARAEGYAGDLVWFSLDAASPVIEPHRRAGGSAFVLRGSQLVHVEGEHERVLCEDREIPIALGGAARHNVANALAAAALTTALGADTAAVRRGLLSMSQAANPGRCNVFDVGSRKVLVDFAHNPQAMRALFDMAQALPARRRALCFGQAGDRPDSLIREMTRAAWAIGLDRVYISELAEYYRGRGPGEVYGVIRDELLQLGAPASSIEHHDLESESFAAAMAWAGEGDLVIMLALGGAAPVHAQIEALIRATG